MKTVVQKLLIIITQKLWQGKFTKFLQPQNVTGTTFFTCFLFFKLIEKLAPIIDQSLMLERLKTDTRPGRSEGLRLSRHKFCVCLFIYSIIASQHIFAFWSISSVIFVLFIIFHVNCNLYILEKNVYTLCYLAKSLWNYLMIMMYMQCIYLCDFDIGLYHEIGLWGSGN